MSELETTNGIHALLEGKAPEDTALPRSLSSGSSFLIDFLSQHYLEEYIAKGGSKIKFLTGRMGAGKTHYSRLLIQEAKDKGFLTASFSAKEVWLNDFRAVYLEILRQVDLEKVLGDCADAIIKEMGEDPAQIPEGKTLMDYLSNQQKADALSKKAIRDAIRSRFLKSPSLDNNFALACALLTGGILGYPILEKTSKDLLLAYLLGEKGVKLAPLRTLGLAPSRISKYNARQMLRSLSEVVHLCGHAGILVAIDDLEILGKPGGEGDIKYTKLRRDDAYEGIRALIDDIDSMSYCMFVMGFDRELAQNEKQGLQSYQALWMRIQSEVSGSRFNRFADIIDLDRLADEVYTPEVLVEMADKLQKKLKEADVPAKSLTVDEAKELIEKAKFGNLGLPYLVNRAVVEGGQS